MNRRWIITLLAITLAGCGGLSEATQEPPASQGPPQTPTAVASPSPQPSGTNPPATSRPTNTAPPPSRTPAPTLSSLGAFEGVLNNISEGRLAPDFTARTMAGTTVSLAALRGRYVLLVPTVVGCGDCVFTMTELAQAYPPYKDGPMEVVILNLFPQDVPESWQGFAETYPEMDVTWAVVNNDRFPVDYDLKTLGTTLLINPKGYIVYRRDHPLWADEFKQLFELVQSAAGRTEAETPG